MGEDAPDMNTAKLYTLPHCSWCKKAKEYMDSHDIAYEEIDVQANEEARQEAIDRAGRYAVPVIDLDGRIQVGYEKEEFDEFFKSLA